MRRLLHACILLAASVLASSAAAECSAGDSGRVEIYPSADVLPANLLRAYIYFPRAMARDETLSHVALLDATGEEVSGAFLETRYNLWSHDRRRLTVLFDPARVKTGLAAHNALGRALEDGARYSIVVRGTAKDSQGCSLGSDVAHSFIAGPADLTSPDPHAWSLSPPKRDTYGSFLIDLGEPHDHVSMAYRLRVIDADGAPVAGRIDLADGERVWRFTPRTLWTAQNYRLMVDPRFEDLAGNRPGALFDRPIDGVVRAPLLALPFRPVAE